MGNYDFEHNTDDEIDAFQFLQEQRNLYGFARMLL